MFHEGDRSKAFCQDCLDVRPTVFVRRDVTSSDGSNLAKNMLVGVCTTCDRVLNIQPQTIPAIQNSRKNSRFATPDVALNVELHLRLNREGGARPSSLESALAALAKIRGEQRR